MGWVLAAFALSQLAAHLAGVRFDASELTKAWQFIDVGLLRGRLLESLYWSHTQPPLFNLYLGLVLEHSPLSTVTTFHLTFLGLGALLGVAVLDLARSLGLPRVTAIVVACLVVCSPSTILYANYLFPTFPTTVALAVSMASFARWVRWGRAQSFAVLTTSTATAVLMVPLVHPIWFVLVVGLALLARRPGGRTATGVVAALVLVPLLLLGGIVLKNQVLFGVPGTSSFFGMNLARTTSLQVPPGELARLVEEGRVDPIAQYLPFDRLDVYSPVVGPCEPAHPDVPVLSRPAKAMGGGVNFNDECFLTVDRRFQKSSLEVIRAAPGSFLRAKVAAWEISLVPPSEYALLGGNRRAIRPYQRAFDRVVLLTVDRSSPLVVPRGMETLFPDGYPLSVALAGAFLVTMLAGVWAAGRWWRRGVTTIRATSVAVSTLVLFVFVVGNTFEIGENNRFVSMVEPLLFVMVFVVGRRALGVLRSVPRRTSAGE